MTRPFRRASREQQQVEGLVGEEGGGVLWPIDGAALDAAPDEPLRWLGDPWPLALPGVELDALAELARRDGRHAQQGRGAPRGQRTRSQALASARRELLAGLASDLAKGVAPFDRHGRAGPPAGAPAP